MRHGVAFFGQRKQFIYNNDGRPQRRSLRDVTALGMDLRVVPSSSQRVVHDTNVARHSEWVKGRWGSFSAARRLGINPATWARVVAAGFTGAAVGP